MSQEVSLEPDKKKGIQWGWIIVGLIIIVIVASFFLRGVEGTVQYYMTVSEYFQRQSKYEGKAIKLAGKVKAGSLQKNGSTYRFVVEDLGKEITVTYSGIVPDTFKDGVDVVVEGRGQTDDQFLATNLMAKCASKYSEGGLPPIEQMRGKSIR